MERQELSTENNIQQIEKKEFSEMKGRLASIIRQVSGKEDVVITTKLSSAEIMHLIKMGEDPSNVWFQRDIIDPQTRKTKGTLVHIPERIFESHEDVVKGKAAHEAGHVAITRFSQFIPDEVLQNLGFHHLILAVEERPTDQIVRERFSGAGQWVDIARKDSIAQTNTLGKSKDRLGYIPKANQLGTLFVYGKQYEEIPPYFDQDVVNTYKKLEIYVHTIEHTLPNEGAPEEEVLEKAKERYKATYKNLWPEVKKLVEQDLELEKLRQLLLEAMREKKQEQEKQTLEETKNSGQKETLEKTKSDTNQIEEALKSLDEEFQKELESILKDALEEQGKKRGKKNQESGDIGEPLKDLAQEPVGKEKKENTPLKKSGEEIDEDIPIPMNVLNQKLIEALEKAYNKLPDNLKEALKEKAKKVLEKLEDEFVRNLSPELIKNQGETHREYEERIEKEKEEIQTKKALIREKQKINEELKEIERHQAAIHASREVYDKFYEELRSLDEKLYRELAEIFTPNIKRTVKLKSDGSKINLPAVFRWESGRGGGAQKIDNKIFETVHLPEKKDYVFTLLNDLSGSMQQFDKYIEDFKAKIIFAEVLNRLGVKNEILGFQNQVITFKTFDEELNDDIRKKMSGMLLEVVNKNPGGNNRADSNFDGPCLLEASRGLAVQPGKEKFLIVISDGMPTGPRTMDKNPLKYLAEAVETIIKNTDQKLIGLGLGVGTEHVKDFYPTSFPNISINELSEILADILQDIILNPKKYSFKPRI